MFKIHFVSCRKFTFLKIWTIWQSTMYDFQSIFELLDNPPHLIRGQPTIALDQPYNYMYYSSEYFLKGNWIWRKFLYKKQKFSVIIYIYIRYKLADVKCVCIYDHNMCCPWRYWSCMHVHQNIFYKKTVLLDFSFVDIAQYSLYAAVGFVIKTWQHCQPRVPGQSS